MDKEQRKALRDLIRDFQKVLLAGGGYTLPPGQRGEKFIKDLKAQAFAKTGLQKVAEALAENSRRLDWQASSPSSFFNYGRIFQEAYQRIEREHGRDTVLDDLQLRSSKEIVITSAIERDVRRWLLESDDERSTNIGWLTHLMEVAGISAIGLPQTKFDHETFNSSLVIQAWTVFESLSEDLWTAAVNSHPTCLAAFAGANAASFHDLQTNSFNVRSKMGAILKAKGGKISFRSLKAIQESYALTFTKQGKAINAILDDDGLRYAAAVRNVVCSQRRHRRQGISGASIRDHGRA